MGKLSLPSVLQPPWVVSALNTLSSLQIQNTQPGLEVKVSDPRETFMKLKLKS
jgi:hypothetical protein